jgi:Cwf15/Cwc15 cell cycle control protein
MSGNVLLNPLAGSSQVKRRWNDDVVFKGQVRRQHTLKTHHNACHMIMDLYYALVTRITLALQRAHLMRTCIVVVYLL